MLLVLSILLGFCCWLALRQRPLDLFQPRNYLAWTFLLPEFVLPGILLAVTSLESDSSILLNNRGSEASVAMAYATLGFLGFAFGYSRRWFRIRVRPAQLQLPVSSLRTLAFVLLFIGAAAELAAFSLGTMGYQFNLEIPVLGATYSLFAQFALAGDALIWFAIFSGERNWRLLGVLSVCCWLLEIAIIGSRGLILWIVLLLLATYQYAKPTVPLRRIVLRFSPAILVALVVGMAFGTTFREVKTEDLGRTTLITRADLPELLKVTFAQLSSTSISDTLQMSMSVFFSRADAVSSLAVIIRDHESNLAAERAAGITNNIVRDAIAGFVPRILWPSKPASGGAEQIGNIYFGTEFNSPAVTYMGDLYRNFETLGVFVGMFILGVVLRGVYRWLIEGQSVTAMRVSAFLFLVHAVNYEGTISTLFPTALRQVFLLWFILWLAGKLCRKQTPALASALARA